MSYKPIILWVLFMLFLLVGKSLLEIPCEEKLSDGSIIAISTAINARGNKVHDYFC